MNETGTDQERTIKDRAYAIWESEGRPEGRHIEHWQQAMAELVRHDEAPVGFISSPAATGLGRADQNS